MIAGVADTHTALWHLFGDARLSSGAEDFIRGPYPRGQSRRHLVNRPRVMACPSDDVLLIYYTLRRTDEAFVLVTLRSAAAQSVEPACLPLLTSSTPRFLDFHIPQGSQGRSR